MNVKILTGAAAGLILGFAAGFLVANSLNKSELEAARTELVTLRQGQTAPAGGSSVELSDKEIRDKVAEADSNPGNFEYQKTLGLALYTYAAMKQDAALLGDVEKLLDRAYNLNPDDYDVIVSLANISFDLGRLNKDEKYNQRARELYGKALAKNEKDARVRTDLGLTYLSGSDPEPGKAVVELKRALEIDPRNEKALQYITQAYTESGEKEDAKKALEELRKVNPESEAIAELEMRLNS